MENRGSALGVIFFESRVLLSLVWIGSWMMSHHAVKYVMNLCTHLSYNWDYGLTRFRSSARLPPVGWGLILFIQKVNSSLTGTLMPSRLSLSFAGVPVKSVLSGPGSSCGLWSSRSGAMHAFVAYMTVRPSFGSYYHINSMRTLCYAWYSSMQLTSIVLACSCN